MFAVININTKEEKIFANFTAAMVWMKKQENPADFRIIPW